jgi:TonB family protein
VHLVRSSPDDGISTTDLPVSPLVELLEGILQQPGASPIRGKADAAPASSPSAASGPLCEIPDADISSEFASDIVAASVARFMKLCMESNGALIYGDDHRLVHGITIPGKLLGPGMEKFYPATSLLLRQSRTTIVSYVVETDGRITSAAILKSSGYRLLDEASLNFVAHLSNASPAYLDFTPVRFYTVMTDTWRPQ